jgi:hypothetical protein
MNNSKFLFPILLLPTLWACGAGDDKNTPDVSGIKVDVKIQRFERDLFALDTNNLEAGMAKLLLQYPQLFPLFTEQIIHDQSNPEELPAAALRNFVTAPPLHALYDTVQQVYGDLKWLEKDISQMFRFYRYYFPQKPLPQVATIISEFSVDAFTYGDSLCGIGLDMFLGENYPGYNPEVFPQYLRRQFQKDYITLRLAKTMTQNVFGNIPPGKRLLDMMLYNGKMLYIVDCLVPELPDSMIMGYTCVQMEGCVANEQAVWARLLNQKLLYSSDFEKFKKLVTPSPNAPVAFQEAPGEIGNWLGWQIVKAYMKRNPGTSMDALLKLQDSQKFMEAAKYKPRRPQL